MSRLVYMCAKVALEMPRVPFTSRTDQKTDELRQLFGLSETENLVEEFMCAMQRKILHQGHMYLFDKHVCFYSNIFGYEKKKCIPLTDVTAVRKAKTALIVPNAIEIMAGGKRNFFASFLSRDEAYRLIVCSWKNCSGYARLYLGSNIDNDGSTTPPDASSGSFTDMGSLKNLDDAGEEVAVADVPVAPPETCATASLVASPFAAMSAFFTRATTGLTASAPSTPKLVGASGPSMSTSGMAKTSMGPLAQSSGAAAVIPGSVDVTADGDADPIPPIVLPGVAPEPPVPETADQVVPEEGPAPPVADTMKLLLEEVMEGLSAAEFVANFYSDPKGAEFQRAYHRNRGDEDVIISEWKPHTHFGLAREISMRSPVKASFGTSSSNPRKCWRTSPLVTSSGLRPAGMCGRCKVSTGRSRRASSPSTSRSPSRRERCSEGRSSKVRRMKAGCRTRAGSRRPALSCGATQKRWRALPAQRLWPSSPW
eukprot:jgi/Mesvir1/10479/Mv21719-RA.1